MRNKWDKNNLPLAYIKNFIATGVDKNGKRFKIITSSYFHLQCLNLWRGNKWAIMEDNKRVLLSSHWN